ncbi:MAG TPA: hypothetical protein VMI54_04425 [Polyangiaceae bacterium]|nr:hypothetical protein [Polyangiaceae bacterium]
MLRALCLVLGRRRAGAWRRCVLLVACLLACSARAAAATVAVLRPETDAPELDEALFRLQGELSAVGLHVAVTERPADFAPDSDSARAWLERTASERDIDAFVDLVVENGALVGAEIWIDERPRRRLRAYRVALEPDTENAPATLAIRAIEVLRSSFITVDLGGRREERPAVTARDETAATSAPGASGPRATARRLGVEAGAAVLTSFDGLGPALLPLARLDLALTSWLALQATVAGFGTRPRVDTAAGSVVVTQSFGKVGLCLCAVPHAGVEPLAALSAGALLTGLDGHAVAPNLGHRLEQWALLLDATVGARVGLPDGFYLTLASELEVAAPSATIHIVDVVVATTGRPNLLASLTAGARF